nr:glutamic acid-rich protein-like [Tanacetum cinerariifolium]
MGNDKITQKLTFYKAFFSSQWKFLIHTILQCLSAKTTTWNEFSSTVASAIICLANNKKFNFSKYIFDNMVKNLEAEVGSTTRVESSKDKESLDDQEDASKQGRMIDNIDQNEEITLVDETQGRMNEEKIFGVNDLGGDEVIVDAIAVTTAEDVEVTTAATNPQISKDELTMDQTLIEIKAAKPKVSGVIVQEPSEFRTTSSSQLSQLPQAKEKEVARKLEAQMKAEMEEEERIAREKDEANIDPKSLKKKLFDEIQKLFDSVMKRVNTFVDMNTEIVEERSKKTQAEVTEGSSKRAKDELEQESAKR